jgi:hypothetical protein
MLQNFEDFNSKCFIKLSILIYLKLLTPQFCEISCETKSLTYKIIKMFNFQKPHTQVLLLLIQLKFFFIACIIKCVMCSLKPHNYDIGK